MSEDDRADELDQRSNQVVHILPSGVESIGYLAVGHVVHQNLLFGVSPPNIGRLIYCNG